MPVKEWFECVVMFGGYCVGLLAVIALVGRIVIWLLDLIFKQIKAIKNGVVYVGFWRRYGKEFVQWLKETGKI